MQIAETDTLMILGPNADDDDDDDQFGLTILRQQCMVRRMRIRVVKWSNDTSLRDDDVVTHLVSLPIAQRPYLRAEPALWRT